MSDNDDGEKEFKEATEQALKNLDELQNNWEKSREQLEDLAKKRKEQMKNEK